MMRIALTLLLSCFALPAAHAAAPQDAVARVMELSGLNQQIDQLAGLVKMNLAQNPTPIEPAVFASFGQIFLDEATPETVRREMADYLLNRYNKKQFRSFIKLLKSPLSRKMTHLENAAGTPDIEQMLMRDGDIIMGQTPLERLIRVWKLDAASGISQSMVEMDVLMARTVLGGLDPALPKENRLADGELAHITTDIRMRNRFPARQYMALHMIYAYRDVSDADLDRYLALYESRRGQALARLLSDAMLHVIGTVSQRVMERVQQELVTPSGV